MVQYNYRLVVNCKTRVNCSIISQIIEVVLYFDWQYGCMHVQAELNIAELELTFSLACSNPTQADKQLLHEENSRQTQAEEFEDMEIDRQFEKGNTDESEDEDMDIT